MKNSLSMSERQEKQKQKQRDYHKIRYYRIKIEKMEAQGLDIPKDLLEKAEMLASPTPVEKETKEIKKIIKTPSISTPLIKSPRQERIRSQDLSGGLSISEQVVYDYKVTDEEKSLDYCLIETIKHTAKTQDDVWAAYDTLYKKFDFLILKMYGKYINKMKKTPMSHKAHSLWEYKSHAFDVLLKAVASLNLNKVVIEKRKTWGFWIQYHNYLNTYNGYLIRQDKRVSLREVPYETEFDDEKTHSILNDQIAMSESTARYENVTLREKNQTLFWSAVSLTLTKLTDAQKTIWTEREKGTPISRVRSILGFNDFRYKKNLAEIKRIFHECVDSVCGPDFLQENIIPEA